LMAIKILAVQIWAFCAPCKLVGSGGRYPRTGSVRLVTRKLLVLVGMPHQPH
jgi:hypothetical protein